MLNTLAGSNYRSLREVVVPLGPLNLITGPNGSGKSNLYRALRLLAQTAQGGVVNALAREGGLPSTFWAGPETLSRGMKDGSVPVQGGPRRKAVRLKLGFADDDFGYAISLGLPQTQVWVVSHAARMIAALEEHLQCTTIRLEKELGETLVANQGLLDAPTWHWPGKS